MAEQLEQKYYTSLFSRTDVSGTGKIEGIQAVTLFRKSGISVQILKQIWTLATPNQEDHLDKNRFFVALKLIALAQDGKPLSMQLLHEKTSLPAFEGIEIPKPPDEWEIGETELNVYVNGFKKLSGDKGFLTSNESKELLQRTQFSPPLLKKIWTLIGLDLTLNMNQDQFIVAMQLIAKSRAGIEIPDILPPSLEKLINKPKVIESSKTELPKLEVLASPPKEEIKRPEVPKLKDPEPHLDTPKPLAKSTFSENYEESPKVLTSRTLNLDLEKHIKEKEKVLKEKTNTLKSICELLDFEQADLELLKEKNKLLEEKIKESDTNYTKIQAKINKVKEKFVKEISESQNAMQALKKENTMLQEKIQSQKSQPPQRVSEEPKFENKSMPAKNIGFEFDQFLKDSLPSQPVVEVSKKEPVSNLKQESRATFGFIQDVEITIQKKEQTVDMTFPAFEGKKTEELKSSFQTNPGSFGSFDPSFSQSKSLQNPKPQVIITPPKNEESKQSFKELNPSAKIDSKIAPKDDIFAGLDKLSQEVNPIPKKIDTVSSSSSNSSDLKDTTIPSSGFNFKFSENLEKKVEKPPPFEFKSENLEKKVEKPTNFEFKPENLEKKSERSSNFEFKSENFEKKNERPTTFEFKTENLAFPAQFEGFNKGFAFPNSTPSFDSDFFKIDTQAIKSKGKTRELEFD